MQRRQAKFGRKEHRLLWRVGVIVALLGLVWLLFAPVNGYFHYRRLKNRVDELERTNAELEQRNRDMSEEMKRLRSDDAYLEHLAREKYGLLKKNETVYEFNAKKE